MRAESKFDLVGDLIGIDAIIVGPTGSAEVTLILDTAAVMTTVVPSAAESIPGPERAIGPFARPGQTRRA